MVARCVLGIDPGLASTGWAIVERSSSTAIRLVGHGCIRTEANADDIARLAIIASSIADALRGNHSVSTVAMERWSRYRANEAGTDAHFKLGLACGACAAACSQSSVAVVSRLDAQGWRRAIGLDRAASKSDVQRRVQAILRLREVIRPQHASDAAAIAIAELGSS